MKKLNIHILTGWFICLLCASCSVDQQFEFPLETGKSAYELWKEDVARGLDDPRTDEVDEWPKTDTTLADFWIYLRGKNGEDGAPGAPGTPISTIPVPPGEPGTPGQNVPPISGKYNVIAQYSMQEYSEYVRWTDGSVWYKVYDHVGDPLPGAIITAMPGVTASGIFPITADDNGEFFLSRDQLPRGVPDEERFGQSIVNGDASAANTWVPEKMAVRLSYSRNPDLEGGLLHLYIMLERRIKKGGEWEKHPDYLPDNQNIKYTYYEVSDPQDATSYTENDVWNDANRMTVPMSQKYLYASRPRKVCSYVDTPEPVWDGGMHHLIITGDSYYGDMVSTRETVHLPAVQHVPVLGKVSAKGYSPSSGNTPASVASISGRWEVSEVDYNLLFEMTSVKTGINYRFNVMTREKAEQVPVLCVFFTYRSGGTTAEVDNWGDFVTLANPVFEINKHVYINSGVKSSVSITRINSIPAFSMFYVIGGTSSGNHYGKFVLVSPYTPQTGLKIQNQYSQYHVPTVDVTYEP